METENGSAARNTGPNDRLGQKAWKYRTAYADAFVTDHVSKARHPSKE